MRFRKLRIAWSVFWGLAAVLLIALWVRSYWVADALRYAGATTTLINVNPGVIVVGQVATDPRQWGPLDQGWSHVSRTNPERPASSFGWLRTDTAIAIRFPIWLCVAVFAVAATLPWIRRRFRLRSLLIATTLVAVVLGLIVAVLRWPAG